MINVTLSVFKQHHRVPVSAKQIFLTRGTTALVTTIGQYKPKRNCFFWQQKIVHDASRAYRKSIGIHKHINHITKTEHTQYLARAEQSAGLPLCHTPRPRASCMSCHAAPTGLQSIPYIANTQATPNAPENPPILKPACKKERTKSQKTTIS